MEKIHLKVMQEMDDELFELIGQRSNLHFVWLAYIFKDNIMVRVDKEDDIEEFSRKYREACINNARMRTMKVKGINLGETTMESYMAVQYMEGKRAFEEALLWQMLRELEVDSQNLNFNWVYLAYAYMGTPDFKEKLEEAKWAFEYEVRMLGEQKRAFEIEDEIFQKLYREAINAYRFYTEGI